MALGVAAVLLAGCGGGSPATSGSDATGTSVAAARPALVPRPAPAPAPSPRPASAPAPAPADRRILVAGPSPLAGTNVAAGSAGLSGRWQEVPADGGFITTQAGHRAGPILSTPLTFTQSGSTITITLSHPQGYGSHDCSQAAGTVVGVMTESGTSYSGEQPYWDYVTCASAGAMTWSVVDIGSFDNRPVLRANGPYDFFAVLRRCPPEPAAGIGPSVDRGCTLP